MSGRSTQMTGPAHRGVALAITPVVKHQRAPRRCACKMARRLEKKNHSPRSAARAAQPAFQPSERNDRPRVQMSVGMLTLQLRSDRFQPKVTGCKST